MPAPPAMEVSKEVNGAMQIKANVKPAAGASGAPTEVSPASLAPDNESLEHIKQ